VTQFVTGASSITEKISATNISYWNVRVKLKVTSNNIRILCSCSSLLSSHGVTMFWKNLPQLTRTQIPVGRSLGGWKFASWHLIFVGPQYGTCFMSPFWRLEFWS